MFKLDSLNVDHTKIENTYEVVRSLKWTLEYFCGVVNKQPNTLFLELTSRLNTVYMRLLINKNMKDPTAPYIMANELSQASTDVCEASPRLVGFIFGIY